MSERDFAAAAAPAAAAPATAVPARAATSKPAPAASAPTCSCCAPEPAKPSAGPAGAAKPKGDAAAPAAADQGYALRRELLAFGAAISGDAPVACEAQATRYRQGDLLTVHSDRDTATRRLSAWVFNLSREWRPEWGGLLLFHGKDGRIVEGFNPVFNSLSLFRVPQDHSVTQVTSFAPRDRLAISGWFLRAPDESDA